ncbi:MAG TPA: hypothetical protein ENJ90_07715 [Devosia sp.]|nr:hypothetical protein [Devosia sp.]
MAARTAQVLDLPPVIDLDSMDNVREWLMNAMDEGDVELNAAPVQRVATNSLLMLVCASQTAAGFGVGFVVSDQSDAFSEAVERLGFSEIFSNFRKGN